MLGEQGGHQQGCGQSGTHFLRGLLGLRGKQVPVAPALLPVGLAAQWPFSPPLTRSPVPAAQASEPSLPTASIPLGVGMSSSLPTVGLKEGWERWEDPCPRSPPSPAYN